MTETDQLIRAAGDIVERMGEEVQRMADVAFPGWRQRVERVGYIGSRCGWYPQKPKRVRGIHRGIHRAG